MKGTLPVDRRTLEEMYREAIDNQVVFTISTPRPVQQEHSNSADPYFMTVTYSRDLPVDKLNKLPRHIHELICGELLAKGFLLRGTREELEQRNAYCAAMDVAFALGWTIKGYVDERSK